jgi:predicted phage terminase large subunit-like protein
MEAMRAAEERGAAPVPMVTRYHVLHAGRWQLPIGEVEARFRDVAAWWPAAPWYSYVAGGERGTYELLAMRGFPVSLMAARWSKYVRAQRTAAAWSAGRILVPHSAPWLKDFLHEVHAFTGLTDTHDDQVDALVSAFDALESSEWLGDGVKFTHGTRCM